MSDTPVSDLALETDWPEFVTRLAARLGVASGDSPEWPSFVMRVANKLHKSKTLYGDQSFSLQPADFIRESIAEAVDLCGWPWIMYCVCPQYREIAIDIALHSFSIYCRLRELERNIVQSQNVQKQGVSEHGPA